MEALAAFLWLTVFLFGCVVLILMCISVYFQWRILGVLASLEAYMRQFATAKSEKPAEEPSGEPLSNSDARREATKEDVQCHSASDALQGDKANELANPI